MVINFCITALTLLHSECPKLHKSFGHSECNRVENNLSEFRTIMLINFCITALTLLHPEWPKLHKSFGCSECNRVEKQTF